jgi:predicted naringenin-chalcone synthase
MNSAGIIALGTAVPQRTLLQTDVGEAVLRALPAAAHGEMRRIRQYVKRLYRSSGIERRHTVLGAFPGGGPDGDFLPALPQEFDGPTTAARNEIYRREAAPLAARAARRALDSAGEGIAGRITHLVTASCTGFAAPGFEIELIRQLGLPTSTTRIHIGFMGCYAALPALQTAKAFAESDPDACVLVVCLELCSLHYRHSFVPDIITANALFADGAAAAVVASASRRREPRLRLTSFRSDLIAGSNDDMQWRIGNYGFTMALSQKVPALIRQSLYSCFDACCRRGGIDPREVAHFAVHPGGKAVLERAAQALGRDAVQFDASYHTLRTCGNMSSATLLFVLAKLLADGIRGPVFAAAFGPGLCAETAVLEAV